MTKVLVVDDTPDVAKLTTWTVRQHDYEVFTAYNGPQALELASAERPDAILLDVMMPGMSGLEVLRRLKEDPELQLIPVLLVTAKNDDQDIIEGLDAGAHDYVTKPFKKEILFARLRSAIRIRQSQNELRQANEQLKREIDERKRMMQELVRAQRLEAIGHLAAGIAHEINTPAQYIGDNTRFLCEAFHDVDPLLGLLEQFVQAAKQGNLDPNFVDRVDGLVRQTELTYLRQEIPKAVEQSLEGIERVTRIVGAMKDCSHANSNGQKHPADLNRIIQSILTVTQNHWKHVARLVMDLAEDLPAVPCLAIDLSQAILNVVVNAADAIAEVVGDGSQGQGIITISTQRVDPWVEIRIEDTGAGIPEAIRQNVFDQFFTTKDVGKGIGLGLSITHSVIVQKHGGTINFETEEGEGTVFILQLPLRG